MVRTRVFRREELAAQDFASRNYVQSLQQDVKKAEDAAGKANAAVQQTDQEVGKVEQAEKQQEEGGQ
ncbi:MAG: hypothetical protein HY748_00005 [Elusimicrobia bacterium]|nr:hypothetical protein [Elusimicrobiota bacterium]